MKCYKCGCSIESGKSFRPIEPKGTPNRKWVCNDCQNVKKDTVENVVLGLDWSEEE